jgi:hypothetical protein
MWLDAFLSAALAVVSLVAAPIIASVGVPSGVHFALGIGVIALAVLLAECGAITFVMIALRLRAGDDLLPARLRLPLPSAMRPPLD